MHLRIETCWDGSPARPQEPVDLVVLLLDGQLEIRIEAPFHGDPAPDHPPGPTPGLWEHEVVELFLAGPAEHYTEIELGPYGHHLVLQLEGVRQPTAELLPLDYAVEREGGLWRGRARLAAEFLPPPPHRINACAIHGLGPERRYLSWTALPGESPDFHRIERFPPFEP